jgi:hypothetical protein
VIDIKQFERLAKAARDGKLAGARGAGRTTWACFQVAMMAARARPGMQIVYLIPTRSWRHHVYRRLRDMFDELGLKEFRFNGTGATNGDVSICLVPIDPMGLEGLRGRDFDLVDDLGELEDNIKGDREWAILMDIRMMHRRRVRGRKRMRSLVKYRARSTPEWLGTSGP